MRKETKLTRIKRIAALTLTWSALVVAFSTTLVSATGNGSVKPHHHAHDLGPAPDGKRYGTPGSPPAVTRDQAMQAVRTSPFGGLVDQATQIDAYYVLFSDDGYYVADSAGQSHLAFQQAPAWIVVLRGVNIPSHGGGRPRSGEVRTMAYLHEMNVVINAQTGEYMMAYAFR